MSALEPVLTRIEGLPTIVGMDSNPHHPSWNPPTYTHVHREAHDLIHLMTDHNLLLRSEPGIPTHFSNNRQGSQTTVDLQWHSPDCHEWAITCSTDISLQHSHFSDHAAIITELSIPDPSLNIAPDTFRFSWSKADWHLYSTHVRAALIPLSQMDISTLITQSDIDFYASKIEQAITDAQREAIPQIKIKQSSRRWWDAATLNPLKGHALNLRRKAQRTNSRDDKTAYRAAQAKFQKAVKDAKRHHWHRFLATLTDTTLFTAAKYCEGPPPSRILPPLRQPNGALTDDPADKAELLFQATGGPTIECDRSDITPLPTPTGNPVDFTPASSA